MLGDRISLARKRSGKSQRQLAAEMGERYDQTMISHVENGRSWLGRDGLSKAATILGVSIDYLFGLTDDPTPASQLVKEGSPHNSNFPDVALVSRVAAVVGTGAEQYDATLLERLPFSRGWLEGQGINPDNCHLVRVQGDLMEPAIPDGCSILVDISVQEVRHDGIFLLQFQQQIIERILKYLTPVRLTLDSGIHEGAPYNDWYISFDKDSNLRWPLSLYDVENVIGEVLMVLAVPKGKR
jgi:transcriptional regulator with XRE-family HTH domain